MRPSQPLPVSYACSPASIRKPTNVTDVEPIFSSSVVFAGHVFVGAGHDLTDGNSGLDILHKQCFAGDELFGLIEDRFEVFLLEEYDTTAVGDHPVGGTNHDRVDGDRSIEAGFDNAPARRCRDDATCEDSKSEFSAFIDVAAESINDDSSNALHKSSL